MSKNKDKIRVSFIGNNSEAVTGSMTLIESNEFKILVEAGITQSNSMLDDFRANKRRLPFKPREIDFLFLGHVHADHSLLIPRLVAEGFHGKIIVPRGTTKLFHVMAVDSAYIAKRDTETLKKKYKMDVEPIYTDEDVSNSICLFDEYDFNEKYDLDENISFRFVPSGHIILASQVELWLRNKNQVKKVAFTSDLGNIACDKYYATKFQPIDKANLIVAESTYANKERHISNKDRQKDLEKIKCIIDSVCVESGHRVLTAIFSLDRCQNIMTHIYDLYHEDESFDIPVLIDSPLAIKVCKLYFQLLEGEQLEKWKEVMAWKNFVFLDDYKASSHWMNNKLPCCVLAASGFMQNGRSREWIKLLLPDAKSHAIFVGYSSPNSLASKVKDGRKQKTISIDGKPYANRCGATNLLSFSSHMQQLDMLKYYSDIDSEKIALVHGEFENKVIFSKKLQEEISRKNKCGKVICVNKGSELLL